MSFGKELLKVHETRCTARTCMEDKWEDLLRMGRPSQRSFLNRSTQPHDKDSLDIFDNTGMMAAEDLAATMFTATTDPSQKWLKFTLQDPSEAQDRDVRLWLDIVAKMILSNYANSDSNFYSSALESMLDLVWYGTGVESQLIDTKRKMTYFRSWSLSNIFLDESYSGEIDSVDRVFLLTPRQVKQTFNQKGDYIPEALERQCSQHDSNKRLEFVEMTFPNGEYKEGGTSKGSRKFQTCYIFKETGDIIRRDGYHELPYHVSRWTKEAGDVYGFGAGIKALPTMKQLQTAKKEWIAAVEVANRPPLLVEDDSILDGVGLGSGFLNISKNSLSQGMPIVPINLGTVPQQAWQAILDLRAEVNGFFYNDATQIAKKRERQTESEVLILQQEQVRKLRAIIGRVEREAINKKVILTYNALSRMRVIPDPPKQINSKIEIIYENAAARAQKQSGIMERGEFLNRAASYAQFDPSVRNYLNVGSILRMDAEDSDQHPDTIKTDEEVQEAMEQEQEQAMQQQLIQSGGQIAKGIKDLSEANVLPTQ